MIDNTYSYFKTQKVWKEELVLLRKLCRNSVLVEEMKWGSPTYCFQGKNVIGLVAFKSYVGLWFHQGVFLSDKHNLLIQSNNKTKGLRKMIFHSMDEILKSETIITSYTNYVL